LLTTALAIPSRTSIQDDADHLRLVRLSPLMETTRGRAEVVVGLIDGPVAIDHPDLTAQSIRPVPGRGAVCRLGSASCDHGTFVAGILSARRGADAPAICPGCTLLVRPIFADGQLEAGAIPGATSQELAAAIVDCLNSGARILNVSATVVHAHGDGARKLAKALDLAARQGAIVVAASGNQGVVGSSTMTRHRAVIPVVSYSRAGRPMSGSNLGASIARRGLGAPGDAVKSLAPGGRSLESGGTSAAAPFVTGAIALIWSQFPGGTAASIRSALASAAGRGRGVVPPLLDAWGAYQVINARRGGDRFG
jgi:subtilisin family serine protease